MLTQEDYTDLSVMSGGKRKLPEAMKIRVELNKKIAKDTKHEGMWIPIIKTVSWIVKKSKSTDSIEKVKEAITYYDSHKDECIKKYKEFNEEYKKSGTPRRNSKSTKARRVSRKTSKSDKSTKSTKSTKPTKSTKSTKSDKSTKSARSSKTSSSSKRKTSKRK